MSAYRYGILRPDASPEAESHNSSLLGSSTLGLEVTIPILAAQCGLGNIDPQHGEDPHSSAIEDAMFAPLPPAGSTLVTIRPDKDSLGAMAVLSLRAEGRTNIRVKLVRWIGLMDSMGFQNAKEVNPKLSEKFRIESDAIQGVTTSEMFLADKIYRIMPILTGEMSRDNLKFLASLRAKSREDFPVEMCEGDVAFILAPGKLSQARDWGNRRYPVAVISDPEHKTPDGRIFPRMSVVRQLGKFDRRGFEELLNLEEAKAKGVSVAELKATGNSWGGPANIVSSPQMRETLLSKDLVLRFARQCLESGHVS